jgi:hypothetical protein
MQYRSIIIAFSLVGCALNARAVTNPVVNCASTAVYANVTDPIKLTFAPDGTMFVGRDNSGSGGTAGDAVKIHRVAPSGSPVTEYGSVAIPDPDAVAYDALGIVSGTPGAVLVGGSAVGTGAVISKINTNGAVTQLFGGVQTNMNNPGELWFDASGRLYISDSTSNAVFATSSSVAPTNLLSKTGAYELALDVSNRLAVGSFTSPIFGYYTTNGASAGSGPNIKAGSPVVAGPGDDFWGRELYAVNSSDQLIRIDSFGNTVVVGTNFDGVISMAFGPDNALYVSYRDYDVILRIAPVASPAPNHWWPAEGNASNAVNTAHGTLFGGVTYQPGKYGQAFRFDALGSEIQFGTNAGNFGTSDFTVMYWVKTTNQAIMYLMSKWPTCGFDSFWTVLMNQGRTGIQISGDSSGATYLPGGGNTNNLADNQWHHLALVRRGVTLSGYQNGVLARINSSNFVAQIMNTTEFKVGTAPCITYPTPPTQRFDGLLDEIKLYHCALTPAQIADAAGIPDPNRPTLNIAALPGAVRLTWTTNATGYFLETNGSLALPAGWGVLTSNYSVIETDYAVTNALGGATRFYRLHKP